MQRQSAAFPRDSAGSAAFEVILALVAGDRGARPFENGFEPWTARGAVSRCPLGRVDFVASRQPVRASDRTPPPRARLVRDPGDVTGLTQPPAERVDPVLSCGRGAALEEALGQAKARLATEGQAAA